MTKASPTLRLRATAYCRIAGGEEQNAILESQKTCYTERIGANPDWIMAGIFADTGDSRSKRPEFQKMLRRCRQKKIDLILVKSVSRFARNMVECLSIVRELRELGVTVIFEQENICTTDPSFDALASLTVEFTRAECEHLTMNSAHTHYMGTISRPTKRTWKKTIRPAWASGENDHIQDRVIYMTGTTPRVIVIPPKPELARSKAVQRQLRVAAYCRVSTDDEEQLTSYEAQQTYYTDKIMTNPQWTMAGIFADDSAILGPSQKVLIKEAFI